MEFLLHKGKTLTIMFTFEIVLLVTCAAYSLHVKCPEGRHWHIRANMICGKSVRNYTCLFNTIKLLYFESCNGPKLEPPGEKAVINSNNFDTVGCLSDKYQPFSFNTSQSSDCVYEKEMCNGEGQIIYNNGSGSSDRRCSCDYTQGFSFVSSPGNDTCSCNPTTHDCSCYKKRCTQIQILSPDYQCISRYFTKAFRCNEVKSRNNLPERNYETISRLRKQMKVQNDRTAAVTEMLLVVLPIIIIIALFMFLIQSDMREKFNICTTCKEWHKNRKRKNIVVVGDAACGKTCLLTVFATNIFPEEYKPTVVRTHDKSITVDGELIQLKLWDTAGHEGTEHLRKSTYDIADVFLVCFAIDSKDSFENVAKKWRPELDQHSSQAPRILVGNKIDIRNNAESTGNDESTIHKETADDMTGPLKMVKYVECSAKTREGVDNVFKVAAHEAVSLIR